MSKCGRHLCVQYSRMLHAFKLVKYACTSQQRLESTDVYIHTSHMQRHGGECSAAVPSPMVPNHGGC